MEGLQEAMAKWRGRAKETGLKWRDLPPKLPLVDRVALDFLDIERELQWDRKGMRYRGVSQ